MRVDNSRVMTVKELSDYLKVHPSTVYRQLKRGQLPAFKVGSDWRFNVESIDRWRLEPDSFGVLNGHGRFSSVRSPQERRGRPNRRPPRSPARGPDTSTPAPRGPGPTRPSVP